MNQTKQETGMTSSRVERMRRKSRLQWKKTVRWTVFGLLFWCIAMTTYASAGGPVPTVVKAWVEQTIPSVSQWMGFTSVDLESSPATSTSGDLDELIPGDSVTVQDVSEKTWLIQGQDAFVRFQTSNPSSDATLSNPQLILQDRNGNPIAVSTNCRGKSIYPCMDQLFLPKNESFLLTMKGEANQMVSAKLDYLLVGYQPKAIGELKVIGKTESAVRLHWVDPNPAGVVKWYVLEKLLPNNQWKALKTVTEPEVLLQGLQKERALKLRVQAVSAQGISSAAGQTTDVILYQKLSLGDSVTIQYNETYEFLVVGDDKTYDLKLIKDGYVVPKIELIGPNGQMITSNELKNQDVSNYYVRLGKLSDGEAYVIRIQPGNHQYKAQGVIQLITADQTPPTKPMIQKVVMNHQNELIINQIYWSASTDEEDVTYEVERDGLSMGEFHSLMTMDPYVQQNSSYTYRVRAFDRSRNVSAWSEPVTKKVPTIASYEFYLPINSYPAKTMLYYYGYDFENQRAMEGYYTSDYVQWDPANPDHYKINVKMVRDWQIYELKLVKEMPISSYFYQDVTTLKLPAAPLPSGSYVIRDGEVWKEQPQKQDVTIYYPKHVLMHTHPVYMHYRLSDGSWTAYPGIKMQESSDERFYSLSIPLKANQSIAEAAFFTEQDKWDNNNGKNYRFEKGTWTLWKGTARKGHPNTLPLEARTIGIQYCNVSENEMIYFHYRTNLAGWTPAPGIEMVKRPNSPFCRYYDVALFGNEAKIPEGAFYRSTYRRWDNNRGQNYEFTERESLLNAE